MNFPSERGGRAQRLHRQQQDEGFLTSDPKESKFKVSALTIKLLVAGTEHGLQVIAELYNGVPEVVFTLLAVLLLHLLGAARVAL